MDAIANADIPPKPPEWKFTVCVPLPMMLTV